jgi:hypothetical protein
LIAFGDAHLLLYNERSGSTNAPYAAETFKRSSLSYLRSTQFTSRPVKNKRLYAILLLAALALLQVRVAFAGCITGAQATASESMATGCDEQPSVSKPSQPADIATSQCAPLCVQPYPPQESDIAVAQTASMAFSPLILFLAWVVPPAKAPLWSISTTPLPRTSIYVLQRLLI